MSNKIISPLIFCALGNPGTKYRNNRHNVGWHFFASWPVTQQQNWSMKFKGEFAQNDLEGLRRYFIIPHTYMNLSGESVQAVLNFFKLEAKNLLVIHDELDLPLGQIEFKDGGGLAGHNGLKSLAEMLATPDFLRLRIGIGRPVHGSVSDWVLSDFDQEQMIIRDQVLIVCAKAIEEWMKDNNFSNIQSKYNKKKII